MKKNYTWKSTMPLKNMLTSLLGLPKLLNKPSVVTILNNLSLPWKHLLTNLLHMPTYLQNPHQTLFYMAHNNFILFWDLFTHFMRESLRWNKWLNINKKSFFLNYSSTLASRQSKVSNFKKILTQYLANMLTFLQLFTNFVII